MTLCCWLANLQNWLSLQNAERLDSEIIYNRDFDYDYFGFKVNHGCSTQTCAFEHASSSSFNPDGLQTLERSYLLRINGTVVERPQHMLMRVAIGIHKQVDGQRCVGCHLASACQILCCLSSSFHQCDIALLGSRMLTQLFIHTTTSQSAGSRMRHRHFSMRGHHDRSSLHAS